MILADCSAAKFQENSVLWSKFRMMVLLKEDQTFIKTKVVRKESGKQTNFKKSTRETYAEMWFWIEC
ncbi:hypothetical protein P3S67_022448 [Capsicum chacoense]